MKNNNFNLKDMKYVVYCLTNDVFEKLNLYKIGYTDDLERRKKELKTTSVPGGPFYAKELMYLDTLAEADAWEKYMHIKLCNHRYTFDREYFEIDNLDIIKPLFNKKIMENNNSEKNEVFFENELDNSEILSRTKAPIREGEAKANLRAKKRAYKGHEEYAFSEMFDNVDDNNPKDGKKKFFKIGFTSKGHLKIENNCPGFKNKKVFEKVLHFNDWHIKKEEKTTGFNGQGLKDAIRVLSDYNSQEDVKMSDATLISSYDGKEPALQTTMHICEDEKRYLKYEDILEKDPKGWVGFLIDIEHPENFSKDNLENFFNYSYSHPRFEKMYDIMFSEGYHKEYRIFNNYKDPFYFRELGDLANKDGLHGVGDKFYSVKTHTATNDEDNKIIKFKTIGLFTQRKNIIKGIGTGIFEMFNDKYLGWPKQHKEIDKFGNGKYNTLLLVIYENAETAKEFGVGEIKNEGGVLFDNLSLDKFKDENGKTPSEIIDEEYSFIVNKFYRAYKRYDNEQTCIEDVISSSIKEIDSKTKLNLPEVTEEDISLNEKAKKENNYIIGKREKERLEKAIEEYNNLPEEERNNLDVKLKYTSNFGTIRKMKSPQKGSKKIGELDDYFEFYPWRVDKYFLEEGEFSRLYYFLTNGKTKFDDTRLGQNLNSFMDLSIKYNREYEKVKNLEPTYSE